MDHHLLKYATAALLLSTGSAHASKEITLLNDILSVRVEQEILSNNVMVSSYVNTNVSYSAPAMEKRKWIWLECEYGKFGAEPARGFPEYGTNCGIEITDSTYEPSGKDAQLLLGTIGTQPNDTDVMQFVQFDDRVWYRGDFGFESTPEEKNTVYLNTNIGGTAHTIFNENNGMWPPGVASHVTFRNEAARITNGTSTAASGGILVALGQCNFQMVGEENGPGGGDWKTQTKGFVQLFQGGMASDDQEALPLIPKGRDYIGITANEDSICSFLPDGYVMRTIREFPGDSWITLWQSPTLIYRDLDANTTPFGANNDGGAGDPQTFRSDEQCGLANVNLRLYIPAANMENINTALNGIRGMLSGGITEDAEVTDGRIVIGRADEGALPQYDTSSEPIVELNVDEDGEISAANPLEVDQGEFDRDSGGIILAAHIVNNSAQDCVGKQAEPEFATGNVMYTKTGSDESTTTGSLSGYSSNSNQVWLFRRLEVLF